MYLGVDIGSSSSKAAIINDDKKMVAVSVMNMGTGTRAYEQVLAEVLTQAGISMDEIKYAVATGYGRINYKDADKQVTEISCHAKGAGYLMGADIRTIIDIGGQDAKVIAVGENGSVNNFVMNEKCAAGTGRFLEVMARVLGCKINELSTLASNSKKNIPISSVCTVFAESEVISRLSAGAAAEDVAKGALVAVGKRIVGMCGRVGYEPVVAMTGGVALNETMVSVLSDELDETVITAPHPQEVGAIGAAVYAYEAYNS